MREKYDACCDADIGRHRKGDPALALVAVLTVKILRKDTTCPAAGCVLGRIQGLLVGEMALCGSTNHVKAIAIVGIVQINLRSLGDNLTWVDFGNPSIVKLLDVTD